MYSYLYLYYIYHLLFIYSIYFIHLRILCVGGWMQGALYACLHLIKDTFQLLIWSNVTEAEKMYFVVTLFLQVLLNN